MPLEARPIVADFYGAEIVLWFIAAANTFVQLAAAPGMRGRMMGLWTMALPGSEPVTGPCVGWVTQYVGPREGFGLPGLALAVIASIGWRALGWRPETSPATEAGAA